MLQEIRDFGKFAAQWAKHKASNPGKTLHLIKAHRASPEMADLLSQDAVTAATARTFSLNVHDFIAAETVTAKDYKTNPVIIGNPYLEKAAAYAFSGNDLTALDRAGLIKYSAGNVGEKIDYELVIQPGEAVREMVSQRLRDLAEYENQRPKWTPRPPRSQAPRGTA